jgi:hypothetical protein
MRTHMANRPVWDARLDFFGKPHLEMAEVDMIRIHRNFLETENTRYSSLLACS